MRIAFAWYGSSDPHTFHHWNDGLRQAVRYMEEEHEVVYHEPFDDIEADLILFWEAPCTINNPAFEPWYRKIQYSKTPKALLFAGGPMLQDGLDGFDMIFTESQINDDELERFGFKYKRAFGINDTIFKPLDLEKKYDGYHPATCAGWKRQGLLCRALGRRAIVTGRDQKNDPQQFITCREQGSNVLLEQPYEKVNEILNESWAMVNTSDFWGGGQRATLEAMAAGTPVIVMEDSPKNCEYVHESGAGVVVKPHEGEIRVAVKKVKENYDDYSKKGIEYVQNKWTAKHYFNNLMEGINDIRGV